MMFGPNSSSSIASVTDHLRRPEQGPLARTTCRYHLPLSDCESHEYQTILFVPTEAQETMIETTTYSRNSHMFKTTISVHRQHRLQKLSCLILQLRPSFDLAPAANDLSGGPGFWICWNRLVFG